MILDPLLDLLRGKAISIAPLDGVFRPNTRLDDAPLLARLDAVDNLAVHGGRLLASSGHAFYAITTGEEPTLLRSFAAQVSALAVSAAGELAVALETGELSIDGEPVPLPDTVRCITALAFSAVGDLWLANGSARHPASAWATDLMEKGASGSLWCVERGSRRCLKIASGIAFPYGVLVRETGIVVSESWRHRLLLIDAESGARRVLVDRLPGYPARIVPADDGGAWLSLFAPRNRLVEFVLQETGYRRQMMRELAREHWIAPALASGRSFLEPLQCGAIRMMGVHKAWSPTRSYGLVVRLDRDLVPRESLHSRADGSRHGVCSVLENEGRLLVAAKGGDAVVSIDTAARRAD